MCNKTQWMSKGRCVQYMQWKTRRLANTMPTVERYCQNKHIGTGQTHLFHKDFAAQCGKWRKEGDRLIVIMDANKHTLDGKLGNMLEAEGVGLVESSHKYWGGGFPQHIYQWNNTHRCWIQLTRHRSDELLHVAIYKQSRQPKSLDHRGVHKVDDRGTSSQDRTSVWEETGHEQSQGCQKIQQYCQRTI